MALVSPAVPRTRVLQGLLVLLVVLVVGPWATWQLCLLLWPARWTLLATWVFAEACFYIFYFLPTYQKHCVIPQPCMPKGFTDADGRRMWRRFISVTKGLPEGIDPEEYLRQWFCDAPFEQIRQENVREMLTYGFFYKKREELSPEMQNYTKHMVTELEVALKMKFPPGYTENLRYMSHLWEEKLKAHPRPLVMYAGFEAMYLAQRLIMAGYGFHHRSLGNLGYYTLGCGLDAATFSKHSSGSKAHGGGGRRSKLDRFFDTLAARLRPPGPQDRMQRVDSAASDRSDDYTPFGDPLAVGVADGGTTTPKKNPLEGALPKGDTPVMFLHGVGGLMLYLEMLKHVIGLGHPVIVVEYKHVGMRLSSHIPSVDELTRNVVDILNFERIPKVCVVGHSYGSFLASRLNMSSRELVHSMCVIDPVALGMFMPHLLHNFMYRRPRVDLKRPDIMLRDLLLWFASRDVHLSATFSRNFYWTEINMWPEDLPPGSCVILSGNDDLCNAEGVEEMCKLSPHIKVIVNHSLFHGAFLLSHAHKANLMAEVRTLLATSGSLVVNMARPVLAHTIGAAHSLLHGVETLTSRLSMSPQPFNLGGGGLANNLDRTGSRAHGLWQTMSGLAASAVKRRSSVPTPREADRGTSGSASPTPVPTRSPSAPPEALGAVTAAAAAEGKASPAGAAAPAAAAAASPAAAAGGGSGVGSPELSPPAAAAAAPAAGWWGAAAAAAAAECDQEPAAATALGQAGVGQQQQQKQLSVILSGPEWTLASELGRAGSSGVRPGPASGPLEDGVIVEDDWVMTDQGGGGSGGGPVGLGLLGPIQQQQQQQQQQQRPRGLGAIREDSQEQQQPGQTKTAAAAGGGAAAAAKGAAAVGSGPAAAAAAPAGSSDSVAVEDQAP